MESGKQKKEQPQPLPDIHEKEKKVEVDLKMKGVEDSSQSKHTTSKDEVAEENGALKPQNQKLWNKRNNNNNNNKPICPRFSIKLTDEEIREDMFIFTGERRLSRNFRRRPKNVQREMDTMFPGMLLHAATPDDYNVPEENSRPEK